MTTTLPLEHLSASSLALHMKCPRQWQDKYLFGNREPTNGSMFLGTVVHLGVARILGGKDLGNPWKDALEEGGEVVWGVRDNPSELQRLATQMIYFYYEAVGKYLRVEKVEQEIRFTIPGVGLPILGYPDLETTTHIIDYKSTFYMSPKGVRVNADWVFQQRLYQLAIPKPSQIHVITRAKDATNAIVVPNSDKHPLNLGRMNDVSTVRAVQEQWDEIMWHLEFYGDAPWPGKRLHEYANKYCKLTNCCSL